MMAMRNDRGPGPLRWAAAVASGLYRSVVLAGLTAVVPLAGAAVAYFGMRFALTWSAELSGPLVILAVAGEAAMAALWTSVVVWALWALAGRPLSEAARRAVGRWTGVPIEGRYRPPRPVTRMATGFWWNGYDYHQSEREARRRARLDARRHDPQARRDAVWLGVAGITVLPAAVLPPALVAAGAYLATRPGAWPYGAAMIVAGLAAAPYGWRAAALVAPRLLGPAPERPTGKRVEELEEIRAGLTQTQAAELDRIERGLHDGAQARLVALGMSMGAAERLVEQDPAAAKALLAEARAASAAALTELRSLVRGINPPVLAERGLVDAVRALALDAQVPVTVRSTVPARPERPVETAVYFAVAELLTNAAKHARPTRVTVDLDYGERVLTATVTDDGPGGAAASEGSGLAGIERRMAAFDGRLEIDSPPGGPTCVRVTVPCALS
jgi:signal transduction histidine kinase